jgi:hypothetical protein
VNYAVQVVLAASLLWTPQAWCDDKVPMAPSDLSLWSEITPAPVREDERFNRASWSEQNWRVLLSSDGKPQVEPVTWGSPPPKPIPTFVPRASELIVGTARSYKFVGGQAYLPTDDGWLVAFNRGEFGAALYWYNKSGDSNYKISDHQVVAFVRNANGIFAIEGLSHLGTSRGSIIRISRAHKASRWRADTFVEISPTPQALASTKQGTLYVVLPKNIMMVTPAGEFTSMAQGDLWLGSAANSAVLSLDESTLYVGMRQFVLKMDVTSRQYRYLLPDLALLKKLTGR